jgi:hypothetical protein
MVFVLNELWRFAFDLNGADPPLVVVSVLDDHSANTLDALVGIGPIHRVQVKGPRPVRYPTARIAPGQRSVAQLEFQAG